MAEKSRGSFLPKLVGAAVLICTLNGALFAADERVEMLEERVAELEALVQQLLQNEQAQPAAGEAPEADIAAVEAHPVELSETPGNSFEFGGYLKLDVLYSDFSGGPVPSGSAVRDFYIPAKVPVSGESESYLDYSAKETRVNFRSKHELDNGAVLGAFIEMDLQLSGHGDERISNSYNPRLRHAYLSYDNWLFGQTWMTFYNVEACPDNLDFIGPVESTIFGRQAMIRYSTGPWQFALENPETTITPYGGGERIEADDNRVPDAALNYRLRGDWGMFQAAGLLRQLSYEDHAVGVDDSTVSYGISLSGRFLVGARDDIRWMASTGAGLGRYIGLNAASGAVLDENGNLHSIDSSGIFGSYRHFWNEKWRSNLTLGYLTVDNPVELTGPQVTRSAASAHLNLIYSPQPGLDFGVEFIYAQRELESGDDGELARLQFSAKYAY